jgi:Amt family ammonium transporter
VFTTARAYADPAQETAPAAAAAPAAPAEPDRTGAFQSTPTSYSVPGYTKPDPDKATTKELAIAVDAAAQAASHGIYSANFVWTLIAGFLVMFMQAGFALVETGLVRAKNAAHTMSMNFMVYGLGMLGFWICGFAFMCGGLNGTAIGGPASLGGTPTLHSMFTIGSSVNGDSGWGLLGTTGFFLSGNGYDAAAIVLFLFMMVFMDTTATIVTGACAERWSFKSFFIFSIFVGGFIYPVFGGWVWGGGWLAQLGYRMGLGHGAVDYAGSGVVHMQGGALAFITALMIGPRIGKYDKSGKLVNPIKPHHIPMVMLGTFILAFGWFGFNAGSSLAGADGRIGIIATNTMLASASGAVAAALVVWKMTGKPDPSMMCTGMLFFDRIGVDDPVGAISVHGTCGVWGLISVGLLSDGSYGQGWNGVGAATDALGVTGLFYGTHDFHQLIAQIVEIGVGLTWNIAVGGAIFWVLGKTVGNRVSPEVEIAGLDIPEMGAAGYPEFITQKTPQELTAQDLAPVRAGGLAPAE